MGTERGNGKEGVTPEQNDGRRYEDGSYELEYGIKNACAAEKTTNLQLHAPSMSGPAGYMGHFANPENLAKGHNDIIGDPIANALPKELKGLSARKQRFPHVEKTYSGRQKKVKGGY